MVDTVETNRFDDIASEQQPDVKSSSFESGTKGSSEHSVLTLRCSNKMDFTTNTNVTTVGEHNEDDHPGTKSLSRRRLVGTMKNALSLSAKKLRRKDKESRIDEIDELDENRNHNETREGVHLHLQSTDFSLSIEDFMFDHNQEQIPQPTNKVTRSEKQTPSKRDKIKNLFKSRKDKSKIDMDIGIKLALPDKIDVMRGLEAPSNCTSSTQSDSDEKNGIDIFSSSQKKLMILPDKSTNVLTRSLTSMSPFKKVPKTNRAASDSILTRKRSSYTNEIVLRSSELEPSVHQTTIPTATEVLIHARVCALMEGYDQLLEARAKAGKRWFSFGDLVGVNRLDLKNMYLNAIGQNPQVPMYIGQDTYQPPPLPQGAVNFQSRNDFGNPFEASNTYEFGSFTSVANSSQSTTPRSHHQKKAQSKTNSTEPHPSIIKSLLECADDIVVENYFNETIGEDSELLETSSSSIQATILSSQRQREFIVCFRASMQQHTKPIQSKSTQTADKNGVNSFFNKAYDEAALQEKVFRSLNLLMSENPFCDICFCGHSFAGNLATIAAVNCAEMHPMMTIKCHTFGAPKIGLSSFKERAHSLPNLNIFAMEFGSDYYVNQPNEGCWTHVGHSIMISRMATKMNSSPRKERVVAQAFKFGKNKSHPTRMKKNQMKADHDMRVYLHAIESFTHLGCQWMDKFVGEDGEGILSSRDNEERLVV